MVVVVVHDQVNHTQFGAAGGLDLVAAAERAGVGAGLDLDRRAAGQAPGAAGRLVDQDLGALQHRVVGAGFERKSQRMHIHAGERAGLHAQLRDAAEVFACGGVCWM